MGFCYQQSAMPGWVSTKSLLPSSKNPFGTQWAGILLLLKKYCGGRIPRVRSGLNKTMNFLLSAGEASGDTYGAQLIDALRLLAPAPSFFGMGGGKMHASGCDLLVHANEVAVVGLVEVFTHLPEIRRRSSIWWRSRATQSGRSHPDRLP